MASLEVDIPGEAQDTQVEGPTAWDITPAIPMVVEPSNAAGKQPDSPSQQRPQTSAEGGSGGGCSSKIPPAPSKQAPKAPPKDRTAQAPAQPQGSLGESEQNATGQPKARPRKKQKTVREKVQSGMLVGDALGFSLRSA